MVRKHLLKIVLYNLVIIFTILAVFELGVRFIGGSRINYQSTSREIYRDNVYGNSFGWQPNSSGVSFGAAVSINALGLRGPEIEFQNKKRLLILGDSVPFGVGIADTATAPALICSSLDSGHTIINTSVIGYGLHDYLNVLHHWAARTTLDDVILFYVLNDLYSASIDTVVLRPQITEPLFRFLRTSSKLYLWIKNGPMQRGKDYFRYDYKLYKESGDRFESGMRLLQKIYETCKFNELNLKVFLLPYRDQYQENTADAWYPQERIIEYFDEENIDLIDCRHMFSSPEIEISEMYLFGDPMHFSAQGHRHLANFVLPYIKTNSGENR